MVPLWNLNCINSNLVHGPPATLAATGPRVRSFSLIFLYKMFFSPSFHVAFYCTVAHHFWEPYMVCDFRFRHISSLSSKNWHVQLILSLLVAYVAAVSHQLCHFKLDNWGG
jgi:hypothetical protein